MGRGQRSVNEVIMIGWIANDPILKETKNDQSLTVFNLSTKRLWLTKEGEKKEEIQYHKVAAWGKLAERLSKILIKGIKVYIRGYLHNRKIQIEGEEKSRIITEIIVNDLLVLDKRPVQDGKDDDNEDFEDSSYEIDENSEF